MDTRPRRGKRGRRRARRPYGDAGGNDGSISGSDVDMDNGPPGIISDFARLGPQRAQVREGVNACRVAALECDLEGVLTDQHDVFDAQLFGAQRLDPGEAPWGSRFAATLSALTRPSQLLGRLRGVFAAFPR